MRLAHWRYTLPLRLRSLFRREVVERELDEEFQDHLEHLIEAGVARGRSVEEARGEAIRELAGMTQKKEECRDMRKVNRMENLAKDLRFAVRQLRKNGGFTTTAVAVLALGICASLAIFAFVDAALLRPLPFRDQARLLGLYERADGRLRGNLSYPDYLDWKQRNTAFQSLDIYQNTGFILSTPTGAVPAHAARVSDGFFRTLGVKPILGRDFYAGEDLPSSPRVVMLGYDTWLERYGGRREVIGQAVILDSEPHVIVGVLPKEFHFAPVGNAEYWAAFHAHRECDLRRSCHSTYGVGRLRDGISMQAAEANLQAIALQLEKEYPGSNRERRASVVALREVIVGDIRPILLTLLGGVGLLLLIAMVNVSALVLVRSESRNREIAVRAALGASAVRLASQFVTEAMVLVSVATVVGVVGANWLLRLLGGMISEDVADRMPFLRDAALTPRVAAFGAIVALLAVLLFSLAPALRMGGTSEGLGSRGVAGTVWRKLGSRLVVLELATAMVLLAGAGLLAQSLYRLLHVDLGFQPEGLMTLDVGAPPTHYRNDTESIALMREIERRTSAIPGVQSVAWVTNGVPVTGNGNTTWFRVMGRPWNGEHNDTPERDVSTRYFTTIGARLLAGRYFQETDDLSRPRVAIVNQAFARHYFPGEDAVGKRIGSLGEPPVQTEIVGVVADIREGPLDEQIPPVLYLPFNQSTDTYVGLEVRTSYGGKSLLPVIAAEVRRIDPGIVTRRSMAMTDRISDSQTAYLHRSLAVLVVGFAATALLLGVVGLYGVVAYSVSRRYREIGVRMALGAQPGSIYQLVLREAGRLTALGIALGVVCSLASAMLMRSLLFGINSWDVPTLAGVAAVLAVSALLASFVPARRAASVNPVDALRAE